jgi:FkbM family methyltransferase
MVRRRWISVRVALHVPLRGRIPVTLLGAPTFEIAAEPTNLSVRRLFFEGDPAAEPETLREFAKLVADARVIADVGANQGLFTLFATALSSSVRVHAFEPSPVLFRALVRNVRLNRLGDRVVASPLAVSDAESSVSFVVPRTQYSSNGHLADTGDAPRGDERTIAIDAVTLDAALAHVADEVDLVKIDVEGAEARVLEGARKILESSRPAVIVEVVDGRAAPKIETVLRSVDYEFFWLTQRGPVQLASLLPDPARRERNYLCLPARATVVR